MKGDNLLSFVGGAVLGAALAILFAPDAGDVTRKKIKDSIEKEYENLKKNFKCKEQTPEGEEGKEE